MAVYIPFVFLSSWVIGRFELRTAMLIGALLNAIGALVRYLGANNFIVLMLGQVWLHFSRYDTIVMLSQTISSIAQTFILGVPARIAAVWFGANERALATSIGVCVCLCTVFCLL